MMPPDISTDGAQAQILLKLGEISTQVAVMQKTLESIPDHETRLRTLEAAAAEGRGQRDTVARVTAAVATAAALGSGAAAWLAAVHH